VLAFDVPDGDRREPVPELAALASSLDGLLARVAGAIADGGRLGADSLPNLRSGYDELSSTHAHPDLVAELDEVVDAANSLAAAVTEGG
jgi:hypothetical protein